MCIIFSLHPFYQRISCVLQCSPTHTHSLTLWAQASTTVSLARQKKSHPSLHPIRGQLYYNLEMRLRESGPAARHGSPCRLRRS